MGKKRGRWRQKLAEDQGRTLKLPVIIKENEHEKKPDEKLFDKLIKKAEEQVEIFDFEQAKKSYESAIQADPNNAAAVEAYASVLLELNEMDAAEKALKKATTLSPDEGHNKYFSLAQLTEGKPALEFYQEGIRLLVKTIEKESVVNGAASEAITEKVEELKLDLSNAYCSMAEIHMSDCCDEDDAEDRCKSCIDNSIGSCPTNPEAFQCLASFQLVKGEIEEAKESMQKSIALWMPKYQESRENRHLLAEDILVCPLSYDARISASKILIELEMYSEATNILEGLLDENDEDVDVWYLLGFVNYLHGPDYYGNARFYLQKTKEVSAKVGDQDEDQLLHVQDLLDTLGSESGDEGEEEGDSDNWETEDEMETS